MYDRIRVSNDNLFFDVFILNLLGRASTLPFEPTAKLRKTKGFFLDSLSNLHYQNCWSNKVHSNV